MLVRSLICLLVLGFWLVADLLNGLVNKATGRHSQGEANAYKSLAATRTGTDRESGTGRYVWCVVPVCQYVCLTLCLYAYTVC